MFLQHFILSRKSFLCRDKSFFGSLTLCTTRSVVLSILCHDTLMCGCWNIYVAILTIVLRHFFCTASSNCVTTHFFYVMTAFLLVLCCNNVSCIVSILVGTKKVCCDRVLSSLILILIAATFLCCDIVYWCSRYLLS